MIGQVDETGLNETLGTIQPLPSYVDLRVRLRGWDDRVGAYPVEAWITNVLGVSSHSADAYFQPDTEQLNSLAGDPVAYGQYLFYALFSGSMGLVFDRAMGLAESTADNHLRMRIWIADEAPELHALYWECMHHQRAGMATPITTIARMPFSRYVDVDFPVPAPASTHHIHFLYVCANPSNLESQHGLAPIDVETEVRQLVAALQSLRHTRRITATIMPGITGISPALRQVIESLGWRCVEGPATRNAMLSLLDDEPGYQILHFLGHGRFSHKDAAATLYFEGKSGKAHLVKDVDLGARIRSLTHVPELVFLAACESAVRHPELGYAQVGFSPQLIRAGVRAVVAMQQRITTGTARQLTSAFYQDVLDHGITDVALNHARFSVHNADERDWWVPVLATSLQDGMLFKPDTVRAMLDTMADADLFNPLPSNADYIPCEVSLASGTDSTRPGQGELNTILSRMEIGAAFDLLLGIPGSTEHPLSIDAPVILLSGESGMGKSLQLKRLGYMTALDSWHADQGPMVLPVYIDVRDVAPSLHGLETACFESLRAFQSNLELDTVMTWLNFRGPRLRLLVDGLDVLRAGQRNAVLRALSNFIARHPAHQLVFVYHDRIQDIADLLMYMQAVLSEQDHAKHVQVMQIQPLSEATLFEFLRNHSHAGEDLAKVIAGKQLMDAVAYPWVLTKLLAAAQRNRFPVSMTDVIADLLNGAVGNLTEDSSLRYCILRTLERLALTLHHQSQKTLAIDDLFVILRESRGNRTYDLERLFSSLCEHSILTLVNDSEVRFTRYVYQTYCCALALKHQIESQPNLSVLQDITAKLALHTHLSWWADVLIFMAGSGVNLESVLHHLLFGFQTRSTGMLVLAARLIQEQENTEAQLQGYVFQSLVQNLPAEHNIASQCQLVDAIARFNMDTVMKYLVRIALNAYEESDSDFTGQVRVQAINAIRRLDGPGYAQVAACNDVLATILRMWERSDVMGLAQKLVDLDQGSAGVDTRSIAIFALADMQTEAAFDILVQAFVYPEVHEQTLSAISTAVTMANPQWVRDLLLAYVAVSEGAPSEIAQLTDAQFRRLKPYVLEIIGQLRLSDLTLRTYVLDAVGDAELEHKLAAIHALGILRVMESRSLLESIALRNSDTFTESISLPDEAWLSLQRQALYALQNVGNLDTLVSLSELRYTDALGHEMHALTDAILSRHYTV